VVPELPASMGEEGGLSPFSPAPFITTLSGPGTLILTPICLKALRVLIQSLLIRKRLRWVSPLAIAPSIMQRWDMDLSPGISAFPNSRLAGVMLSFMVFLPIHHLLWHYHIFIIFPLYLFVLLKASHKWGL
jgi:hypothetical protein